MRGWRAAFLTIMGVAAAFNSAPARADFQDFVARLWVDAHKRGVPRPVFDAAFAGVQPDPAVMEKTRRQPEFAETTAAYVLRRVSDARIEKGRAMAAQWSSTLDAIEAAYGVDRYVVLSVWGNETNFGGFMGGHSVITALATLTYYGYRADYFRKELLNALEILARGDTQPQNMIGSWAGAMGHTQFMPSSFKAYAVDFDRDGRRDIWTTIPDALASTANYLKKMGWRPGQTWGYEVLLPADFDFSRAGKMGRAEVGSWKKLGVVRANTQDFPRDDDVASLFMPSGANGPAFLLIHNFQVIKRYNNANNYALAVGHLADRIRGSAPFVTPWPADQALSIEERREIQQRLAARGYPIGEIDGVLGSQTQAAIRAFQAERGLPQDGFASGAILRHLRQQ